MFRYIAIAYSNASASQYQRARELCTLIKVQMPQLQEVFAASGLIVLFQKDLHRAYGICPLSDGAGIVLGALFHQDQDQHIVDPQTRIDGSITRSILKSDGQALLQNYWGRYVAFLCDAERQTTHIIPDPTGESPCYIADCGGMTLLFSGVADIVALRLLTFSINWRYVAASLVDSTLQVSETGLNEVSQLRAGESLLIFPNGKKQRTLSWDLFSLALSDPITDIAEAANIARRTVQHCVSAWASRYSSIVHLLSGGIDSSIILACLLRAPSQPDLVCLNLYDSAIGGDERKFARLACEGLASATGRRCELIERERSASDLPVALFSSMPLTAFPEECVSTSAFRSVYLREASDRRAAVSLGAGGDYIFYRTSTSKPAIDYVYQNGLGLDLLRIVHEHTGSRTFWGVLAEAISAGYLKRNVAQLVARDQSSMISPDIASRIGLDLDDYLSPIWAQSPALCGNPLLPPGKRRHLETLYMPVRKHDPFDDSVQSSQALTWLTPLLSQPIIELFARIPVYVLKSHGIERAVARSAFAGELPKPITQRLSKCITNSFLHKVFEQHNRFFREMLLDGILVQHGMLDREKLEAFFVDAQDGHEEGFSAFISTHIDTELWLRNWHQAIDTRPGIYTNGRQ